MVATWDSVEHEKTCVQLIHAKTKSGCVLFAGYFSSTIESRTIGQGFPGLRDELLSKELVHPRPDNGENFTGTSGYPCNI